MAITTHTQNRTLGRGKVYFAPEDDADGGMRYLGDSATFGYNVETERVEAYDSEGPTSEKVEDEVLRVTRSGTLTLRDVSDENLALFLGGAVATHTQNSTPVSGESVGNAEELVGDRIYQLGVSSSNPVGVKNIGSVAIKSNSGATTHTLGTDYELDTARGAIKVIAGGGLDGTAGVTADYTPVASTRDRITTSDDVGVTGRLEFVEDNLKGENRTWVAPQAKLTPNGETVLKNEDGTWRELTFNVEFVKGATLAALYCDGAVVNS